MDIGLFCVDELVPKDRDVPRGFDPDPHLIALNPKIGLCLESFAVGEKAKRAFAGGETDEEFGGEGPGEEPSTPAPL